MAKRASTKSVSALDAAFSGEELIVVLHGQEPFLRSLCTARLREAIEGRVGDEVERWNFDGKTAELADVFDELRSFGLMQQHKLVIVDEADDWVTAHREALERYAKAPVETATLLLRANGWRPGNLDKLIVKVGAKVECKPLRSHEAAKWLSGHAKSAYGVTLAARGAAMLVEHLGANLGLLDTEVGKLAAGVEPGKSIDVGQIEALVGRASEEKAWIMQEALLSGDAQQAVRTLHELLDLANQPKELVMYFAADLCRKLYRAWAMLEAGQGQASVARELKIWPQEKQRSFFGAVGRLGGAGAAGLLDEIVTMDRRAKSGFADAVLNLERFCVRFTAVVR